MSSIGWPKPVGIPIGGALGNNHRLHGKSIAKLGYALTRCATTGSKHAADSWFGDELYGGTYSVGRATYHSDKGTFRDTQINMIKGAKKPESPTAVQQHGPIS